MYLGGNRLWVPPSCEVPFKGLCHACLVQFFSIAYYAVLNSLWNSTLVQKLLVINKTTASCQTKMSPSIIRYKHSYSIQLDGSSYCLYFDAFGDTAPLNRSSVYCWVVIDPLKLAQR